MDRAITGDRFVVVESRPVGDSSNERLRIRLNDGRELFIESSVGFSRYDKGITICEAGQLVGALNLSTGQYAFSPCTLPPTQNMIAWLLIVPGGFFTFGISAVIGFLIFAGVKKLTKQRSISVDSFVKDFATELGSKSS